MSLKTQHEFLFVGREEGSFVENYAYDIGEGNEKSGKIFLNIEIQNNPAEAENIAETIFDTMRKSFFADLEKDPYVRFEEALKDINQVLHQIQEESPSRHLGTLNVLIAAVVQNNLYLTQTGDAEAYLIRKRFCSIISEGLHDVNSEDFFTNIASGELESSDFVLLSSTRLLRYITKNDLAKVVSGQNLVSILAELKDYLMAEVLSRMGFIGILTSSVAHKVSSHESGEQVVAHLQKEEEYEQNGVQGHKSTNVTLQEVGKKMTDLVSKARSAFSDVSQNRSGNLHQRSERATNVLDMNFWSKNKILIAFVGLAFVFVLAVWWMKAKADEQDKINQYVTMLNQAEQQINSAVTTAQYNPAQSAQLLSDAQTKAKTVLDARINRAKALELLSKIEETRDQLDGVIRIEPKPLVDLSQKRSNINPLGILPLKDALYVYEYNALYPILLDQLKDPLTVDGTFGEVAIGTSFEDQNSLLFYTKDGKVIEFKDNRFALISPEDDSYAKGVSVQTYSNKFYILDPTQNQIWRYVRRRDNFSKAEKYNLDNVDIKKTVSFAIDSDIYVLQNDGGILKFTSGKPIADFSVKKGPSTALQSPTRIFTKKDMTKVFVLDPALKRVLVYAKNTRDNGITYVSQYVFENVSDLKDIYVDIKEENLYLLDQTKVYRVPLQ